MRNVRLGLICYATSTGLGHQTRALHRHLNPAKIMLVDISSLNGMPVHEDWYDYDVRTKGYPTKQDIDAFLDGLDVVFYCETPLNYYLVSRARELGIKTICQPNYEFLDYMTPGGSQLPRPDLFAAPSTWHLADFERFAPTRHVPVPVDLADLPQRTITEARRFFHTAGRPAARDRNGTLDFIQAAKIARPFIHDAEFIVYCQQPTPEIRRSLDSAHMVRLVGEVEEPADMYREGDVLVLPRRYGGLCLPAQEAIGCGIPVLMPDVSPNNDLLPDDWLLPATGRTETFVTRGPVEVHQVNVTAMAQKMLDLYRHPEAVRHMHEEAKELAQAMSWEAMKPMYEEVIREKETP